MTTTELDAMIADMLRYADFNRRAARAALGMFPENAYDMAIAVAEKIEAWAQKLGEEKP